MKFSVVLFLFTILFTSCIKERGFPEVNQTLSWTMVNVNNRAVQGDAHIIKVEGGKTILIDAGFDGGDDTQLTRYLEAHNIDSLDYVFISHPHNDHYNGLHSLMRKGVSMPTVIFNMPDKALCDTEQPHGCDYSGLLYLNQKLTEHGSNVIQGNKGDLFDLGNEVTMTILYAMDGVNNPLDNVTINDLSMIMKLNTREFSTLFTGDILLNIAQYLVDIDSKEMDADFLKIPHHGNMGMYPPDSFYDLVSPLAAFAPAPAWLWSDPLTERGRNYFDSKNIPVYVNGIDGNVEVLIENDNYTITTEK
jgi:competence protein ComEC